MDLSAVIFVVLALAWAVYLIPKALQHHDEMASDRLVEGHSERVRILRRRTSAKASADTEVEVETAVEVETVETTGGRATSRPRRRTRTPTPELTPAGKAARRRRRVLALLLVTTAVVSGLAYYAYVPWLAIAGPVAAILLFLVIARFSVRKAGKAARRRPEASQQWLRQVHHDDERVDFGAPVARRQVPEHVDVELHDPAPAEMASQALADEGSLWDPLPMTLPTYVNKARARRTVRTIELTGMQSSGHDQGDSDLAREAGAEAQQSDEQAARKAAGA